MMATKKQSPKDIQYLAFEGGGGMGIAYLGAIKALEELDILPISKGRIKGISGASAGAITALMVSLGLNYSQIATLSIKHGDDFIGFFDKDPSDRSHKEKSLAKVLGEILGEIRGVDHTNFPIKINISKSTASDASSYDKVTKYLPTSLLEKVIKARLLSEDSYILLSIIKESHWKSLFCEGALFPGFYAREHFRDQIWSILGARVSNNSKLTQKQISNYRDNGVPFQLFYDLTKVDLVISGTNITRKRSGFFSVRHTPDFPVHEAIGISMSIPFLFKPVCLSFNLQTNLKDRRLPNEYHGLWCDGGVLNNFPIHAFDGVTDPLTIPAEQYLKPLNPNLLGLRVDKDPNSKIIQIETGKKPKKQVKCHEPSDENIFNMFSIAGNLYSTFMYPGSLGQIRSFDEKQQTINIDAGNLSLVNFTPSPEKYYNPILKSYLDVWKYFGEKKTVEAAIESLKLSPRPKGLKIISNSD